MNCHQSSWGGAASDSWRSTTMTRPGGRVGFWSSSNVPSGLRVPATTTSGRLLGCFLSTLHSPYCTGEESPCFPGGLRQESSRPDESPDKRTCPSFVLALRNEAGVLDQVMAHGRHPGIVPLLHTYLGADPPCLEYEYVEGGDLAGLIREMHERGEGTPEKVNRFFLRLAEIVAAAHGANPPVVHDDLKPSNVLIQRLPDGIYDLKVTDYGIGGLAMAQAVRETRQPTRSRQELLTTAVRGAYTPLYASPEQMARRRGEPPDPRDDVHALGVIWYQMLTGDLGMLRVPPDWREEVQKRGLGEEGMKLLGSCISPKAPNRPDNAGVLAERLRALAIPVPPPPQGRPDGGATPGGTWKPLWVAAALGVLAFFLPVTLILWAAWHPPITGTAQDQSAYKTTPSTRRPTLAPPAGNAQDKNADALKGSYRGSPPSGIEETCQPVSREPPFPNARGGSGTRVGRVWRRSRSRWGRILFVYPAGSRRAPSVRHRSAPAPIPPAQPPPNPLLRRDRRCASP